MADHNLEIAGLGLFLDYCFIKSIAKIKLPMLNAKSYKVKDDLEVSINLHYFGLFRLIIIKQNVCQLLVFKSSESVT